jgi:predicted nucleotidyltransferase
MRTVGLIVEYNPFHNGHLYHLQQSVKITRADAVVAVMSGHFLQRGEPALADKWARAEMALHSGCDLVIELPVAYATQAAEWFAYGAVSLLDATGVVDALCFGSESGEIGALRDIARVLADEPAAFRELLSAELKTGSSYPAAYSEAVKQFMAVQGNHEAANYPLAKPNNTLGLHYLLALERLRSPIEPYTITREGADYNQSSITDAKIASATALRRMLLEERSLGSLPPFVPSSTSRILEREWSAGRAPLGWETFTPKLLHEIARTGLAELESVHEMAEGLHYRLKQSLPSLPALDFESLIGALKTKRYTRTKLQRALLALLLGHRKEMFGAERLAGGVQYIRVLGFTAKGQKLLGRMRTEARLPVLHSAARPPADYPYLELDVRASAVYALGYGRPSAKDLFRDYYEAPFIV